MGRVAMGLAAVGMGLVAQPSLAAFRLPPLDSGAPSFLTTVPYLSTAHSAIS